MLDMYHVKDMATMALNFIEEGKTAEARTSLKNLVRYAEEISDKFNPMIHEAIEHLNEVGELLDLLAPTPEPEDDHQKA
jgi:hypothetical protein